MLRNLVISKLTRMRNNGCCKQQIDDRDFVLCVFEAGFEDVLKNVQS